MTAPHEPPPPPPPTAARGLAGLGEVDRGPAGPTGSPGAPVRNRFPLPLLIFLLSIVVAVVGLAAVWQQPGLPGASTPSASAIDTLPPSVRTPSSPTDSPTSGVVPSPQDEAALARAIVDAVEVQVPALRGLQPTRAVPSRLIGEEQLVAELTQRFKEENPHARLGAQGALLQRLGLLPAGADLEGLMLEMLSSQVIGFYDDKTKTLSVVERGTGLGPLERTTVAHEYTHALQDQHFGLAGLGLDDPSDGDRSLARLSLVEGDATLLMTLWSQQFLSSDEQAQMLQESLDPTQLALLVRLPPFLVQELLFPYQQGLAFVGGLRAQGGWSAVDAVYARPPDSTAQILHPELYAARVQPVPVVVDTVALAGALAARSGGRWTAAYTDTLGEFTLGQWLQRSAGAGVAPSAVGWRGDRAAYLEGPQGRWYVVLRSSWESGAAAARFAAAARAALGGLAPYSDVTVGGGGRMVTVSLADVPLVAVP